MATPEQEEGLRVAATALEEVLAEIYGTKMGFFLCVSPFECETGVADYIANADRESGIKWLRETADRLSNNGDIPATKGNA